MELILGNCCTSAEGRGKDICNYAFRNNLKMKLYSNILYSKFLLITIIIALNALSINAKERIILSPTKSFYSQVDCRALGKTDVIYEICNAFDLRGNEIVLPNGSTLLFKGGLIKNGSLKGYHTFIEADKTAVFDNVKLSGSWNNEEAYPEWYGAKGNGKVDDTKFVYEAINSPLGNTVRFGGIYLIHNNSLISAHTTNRIFDGGEFICMGAGLHIVGNNLSVRNVTIHCQEKLNVNKLNYSHAGLAVNGNNNSIENSEVYNMSSCGISVGGKNIIIRNVNSHDNHIGMVVGNTVRGIKILDSRFENNNVVSQSGADGILFQRTASDVLIDNCIIVNNGEHGVYFQGQNAVFRNNTVLSNTLDGLKFGSYDDGGYVYPDEKVNLWVERANGVTGFNGKTGSKGFGVANVTIENNRIEDNRGGDAIYFQPSAMNIQIKDNIINNNDITCSFFNYTGSRARLEDINNIIVENNKLSGVSLKDGKSSRISVSATSDVRIINNKCGRIEVYAPNKTTAPHYISYLNKCIIENNECSSISINRTEEGIIRNNKMEQFSTNTNCAGLVVVGNEILKQRGPIIFNVIKNFSKNTIVAGSGVLCYETDKYKPKVPELFQGNDIMSSSIEDDFIRFYGPAGKSSLVKGNVISCAKSNRPISISSDKSIAFENNVVIGRPKKGIAVVILKGSGVSSRDNSSNGVISASKGAMNKSNLSMQILKSLVSKLKK